MSQTSQMLTSESAAEMPVSRTSERPNSAKSGAARYAAIAWPPPYAWP